MKIEIHFLLFSHIHLLKSAHLFYHTHKYQKTFSGTLSVVFKNGYTDYVSRRNIKAVKERIGIKK